jgi:DNA-binding transcriptional MerR regulator
MQRLYYSISEVAQILDEETYVLRYWEKEFPQVSPKKNKSGKRVYSDADISILKIVKKLLRDDKLSILGAKEQIAKFNFEPVSEKLFLEEESQYQENITSKNGFKRINPEILLKIKDFLSDIKKIIENI